MLAGRLRGFRTSDGVSDPCHAALEVGWLGCLRIIDDMNVCRALSMGTPTRCGVWVSVWEMRLSTRSQEGPHGFHLFTTARARSSDCRGAAADSPGAQRQATGRADFRRTRRPDGRRCGPREQARERRAAIQAGNRRPDWQTCRRRDRTRPRGSQPDIDAASEACLGCPVQVLFPARAIRQGATARGALAADRESFRRVADDGRLDVRGRLVAALSAPSACSIRPLTMF